MYIWIKVANRGEYERRVDVNEERGDLVDRVEDQRVAPRCNTVCQHHQLLIRYVADTTRHSRCTEGAVREAVARHKHHRRVGEYPDIRQCHCIDEILSDIPVSSAGVLLFFRLTAQIKQKVGKVLLSVLVYSQWHQVKG